MLWTEPRSILVKNESQIVSKSRKCPHARKAAKKRAAMHVETIKGNLGSPIPARATVMTGRVKALKDPFNESGVLASMSPRFNDPVGGVFKSKIIDTPAQKARKGKKQRFSEPVRLGPTTDPHVSISAFVRASISANGELGKAARKYLEENPWSL